MKILIVSHTYISSINREKWKVFSKKYPQADLKILIPKKWPANFFNIEAGNFKTDNLENCEFIALGTRNSGNEVLYSYKFFDLIKLIRSFKPDLIHVEQGDNAFSYFQLILLSRIFSRKTKFSFFTWVNWKHKWSFKYKLFWGFIERFNLKHSSGAIVGNNVAKDVLRDKFFLKEIQILLQLGVDQKYFYPAKALNSVSSEKTKFKIGFIGRIIKEKGVFDLIKAFSLLENKYNNWELVFLGNGDEKNNLINFIQQNKLIDRVEFIDSVDHKNVGIILNQFDIFVLPSYDTPEWKEQFGHVLIEAMACEVPILGSTGGYIPNVIGDSGLIFKQKNINDLKDKLEMLMASEDLRKSFALSGFNRFKNNFSYEMIADKTYSFWNKIL